MAHVATVIRECCRPAAIYPADVVSYAFLSIITARYVEEHGPDVEPLVAAVSETIRSFTKEQT